MLYVMLHLGDWSNWTRLYSLLERGILIELIAMYFSNESAINPSLFERITRRYTEEELKAFNFVIEDFFYLGDDGLYHNDACDQIIAKSKEKSEKARKSIQARWSKKTDEHRSKYERNTDVVLTNIQEPITNNQEIDIDTREKPARRPAQKLVKPEGVSDQVFDEWQALKRKLCKGCTQRMVDAIAREAEKAGMTVEQAMTYQLEKGWKGFEADWVRNAQPKKRPTDPQHGIGVCQPLPEEEVHWLTDEDRAESLRQMEAEGCAPF